LTADTELASGPVRRADPDQLARLAPLSTLSAQRLAELCDIARVAVAPRGSDLLRSHHSAGTSLYLLRGELLLAYAKGGTLVIVGGSEEARQPINRRTPALGRTKAITDVDVLQVEDEVLDVLMTWDQVTEAAHGAGTPIARAVRSDARLATGPFSLGKLRGGAFAQLPAANIEELLRRFERVPVKQGSPVLSEGDDGDYYYCIESGRFRIERMVGGVRLLLAELRSGEAFGEEALVSGAKRNASVTAATDGVLLRLAQRDFDELLREPLLRRLAYPEAVERVAGGAVWLDVRYPSEYQYDKLPGAINVPLNEVRDMFNVLDRSREYVVYCQSGRRSAAAAFLFAQKGFKVALLEGGLWAATGSAK
jgi:rhodanese-related sulfurtransferase